MWLQCSGSVWKREIQVASHLLWPLKKIILTGSQRIQLLHFLRFACSSLMLTNLCSNVCCITLFIWGCMIPRTLLAVRKQRIQIRWYKIKSRHARNISFTSIKKKLTMFHLLTRVVRWISIITILTACEGISSSSSLLVLWRVEKNHARWHTAPNCTRVVNTLPSKMPKYVECGV